MLFTSDMKELLEIFNRLGVDYAVVGGFAVNYYGYVRTTQDIDILILPSKGNAEKVMEALNQFGFGGAGIPKSYFEREGTAIHLGEEPNRIDLLTALRGVDNRQVFSSLVRVEFEDTLFSLISLENLLACKKASRRPKDLADADELEKTVKEER